jgi:transcription-repair coupling factor (superfamily II helicase)
MEDPEAVRGSTGETHMKDGPPAWLAELVEAPIREALEGAAAGQGPPRCAAASAESARLLAAAAAIRAVDGPVLVVAPDDAAARRLTPQLQDLLAAADSRPVVRLPSLDADPYRGMPAHPAVAAARVDALQRFVTQPRLVLVTSAAALLTPVPGRETIERWAERIGLADVVDLDQLARRVVAAGYRTADVVSSPGDFARRGGLFDIWPPQEDGPLRVELWGDEVDSIRRFDSASQRTTERIDAFRWLPAREAPITAEQADTLLDQLLGRARELLTGDQIGESDLEALIDNRLAGIEGAPRVYREDLSGLDQLVEEADIWVWGPDETAGELDRSWQDRLQAAAEAEGLALPDPESLFESPQRLERRLADAPLAFSELPLDTGTGRELLTIQARRPAAPADSSDAIGARVREASDAGRPVVLSVHSPGRRLRLLELLEEAGVDAREEADQPYPPGPGEVVVVAAGLEHGAEFGPGGPLLLTEQDLFGPEPAPPPPRRRRGGEAFVSDLRDLREGDLVVHVDHGIARYLGLGRRNEQSEELLTLEYAGGDRLFVPVTRLDLIQKYSGGAQALAPLDRLGGQSWTKRRRKVRREVEEMAKELLELYAKRRTTRASAFGGGDSEWQQEFEQSFPHDPTEDQAQALGEIKADLASTTPMDRLLCGDVGFGKTEVALRAAFKVVQEGAQVAVLVPTTVLAFQHQTTFRSRMAGWPVRVEAVSRLVPSHRVREILEDAASGQVDVLVGTHRLLSQDVRFKRLGLLIVDEEQRFGVRHKERLKQWALGVHVLSMTATPIPRTLQMSLAGVRELSVIETPPRNRLAIQTQLASWSPSLIAAAIRKELARSGQVYFIHPRVADLERTAAMLAELVPEASFGVAHGQMSERQLEDVMLRFIRGQADVLVSTSIVENGLDIPRANTLIVNEAHRFGLSQLYQMRGRVGRSDVRAYAYLLVPSQRSLTAEARQRLSALVEFTDLGSGFRIAALDLEIRGAGDFLGARQSGHIASVGFEMYADMLEDAVRRIKGESVSPQREPVTLRRGVNAELPEAYVPSSGQRLSFYKRLSSAEDGQTIELLRAEAEDRFGALPESAENLFRLAELRLLAEQQGATVVEWLGDGVGVRYGTQPNLDAEALVKMLQSEPGVGLTPAGLLKIRVPDPRADRITAARLALRRLRDENRSRVDEGS